MSKVKATFYLPLRDNNGQDLSSEIAEVEDSCFECFDGWTLCGFFKGAWKMESGLRQTDTTVVYSVILPKKRLNELEDMLRAFKAKTSQEAIYLEVDHEVEVRFI